MLRLFKSILIIIVFIPFFSGCMRTQSHFAKRNDVQQFINHMSQKHGFQKQSLNELFDQVQTRPEVIRMIKKPLEKKTWNKYQSLLVTNWRIQNGVRFWDTHHTTLSRAEQQFGVPTSIIIATLGIETRYGKNMGSYRVIDSLANLAFNHAPRSAFFKQELEEYLLLTRENHLNPLHLKGSYAGAIGQPQFMPSSYRTYAIDFSRTGSIDLMNNTIDVIGSIANYYKKKGWVTGGRIASPIHDVKLYQKLASLKNQRKTIAEWKKLGITAIPLIPANETAILIELDNQTSKEYWLGYRNFEIIKRYNASSLYAMAVFQLSKYIEKIKGRNEKTG